MTIHHLPHNPLSRFTWQPFGFISAAEGFVFLSGLVAGWVYGRTAVAHGVAAASHRVLKRALIIYVASASVITFGVLAAAEGVGELGNGFQPSLGLWVRSMLFLVAAPGYAEILRMYCVFFLLLPAVLWAIVNGRFRYVGIISAGLWFGASLGYGMTRLPDTVGYFDIVSWQVLFVAGVYFGFMFLHERRGYRMPATATAVCFAVVVAFLVVRGRHFLTGQELSPYLQWLSSWRRTLSVGRMVDFAAFALLLYRYRGALGGLVRVWPARAIAFLGQHSLQVFVWSVCASMVAAKAQAGWLAASRPEQVLLTSLILASCFLPAWLHQRWQRRHRHAPEVSSGGRATLPPHEAAGRPCSMNLRS
jgi:hypothetical protein